MAFANGFWDRVFPRKNASQGPFPEKERRRAPRYRMDLPVRFRIFVPGQAARTTLMIPAQLYDISENGIGLLSGRMEYEGLHLITPDQQSWEQCRVEIEIPFGKEALRVQGRAVWYVPNPGAQTLGFRVGIELVEVTAALRERIRAFVTIYRAAAEV